MLGDAFNLFALATVSWSAFRAAYRSSLFDLVVSLEWLGRAAVLAPRVFEYETEDEEEETEDEAEEQ